MKRILALDVGERRIGVAISDPLGVVARTLGVVERRSDAQAIQAIVELVREHDVERVLVGHPRTLRGETGPQAQRVEAFAALLESALQVPVELWDEWLSTVSAERILSERGISAREQKATIDAVAAAVILQDYLDAQSLRDTSEEGPDDEDAT
jgi:putative Holliday junction resolvase